MVIVSVVGFYISYKNHNVVSFAYIIPSSLLIFYGFFAISKWPSTNVYVWILMATGVNYYRKTNYNGSCTCNNIQW
jgi:hypothetical protein